MKQAEFEHHIGAENICASISDALARAAEVQAERLAAPADPPVFIEN